MPCEVQQQHASGKGVFEVIRTGSSGVRPDYLITYIPCQQGPSEGASKLRSLETVPFKWRPQSIICMTTIMTFMHEQIRIGPNASTL